MKFEIEESSPIALDMIESGNFHLNSRPTFLASLPLNELNVGNSIRISFDKVNKHTLRNYLRKYSEENDVLIKTIVHKHLEIYEIARVKWC